MTIKKNWYKYRYDFLYPILSLSLSYDYTYIFNTMPHMIIYIYITCISYMNTVQWIFAKYWLCRWTENWVKTLPSELSAKAQQQEQVCHLWRIGTHINNVLIPMIPGHAEKTVFMIPLLTNISTLIPGEDNSTSEVRFSQELKIYQFDNHKSLLSNHHGNVYGFCYSMIYVARIIFESG